MVLPAHCRHMRDRIAMANEWLGMGSSRKVQTFKLTRPSSSGIKQSDSKLTSEAKGEKDEVRTRAVSHRR
jgi:hypothetical protein